MSFEEKLIEAVRVNPIMYDLKHPNYRRVDIKDKIWLEIARNLKLTDKICKKKWKSLRDAHRRARRVTPSGSADDKDIHKKAWKYLDLLNFLCSVNDQRETVSNFKIPELSWESASNEYSNSYMEGTSMDLTSEPENVSANGLHNILCSTRIKKSKESSNDIHNNFLKFLNDASEAMNNIDKVPNQPVSSTTLLFSSLALKIENANLPAMALTDLELSVSNLVYNTLRDL